MSALGSDLRHAARSLGRRPGWTVTAIATLALGLGGAIAVASVAYGVLVRPLPYPEPDRLVRLYELGREGQRMRVTDPNFLDLESLDAFEGLAEYAASLYSTRWRDRADRVMGAEVSRDFFALLRVEPIVGRLFRDEERREGGSPAVVVGERYWREVLGAPRSLDGVAVSASGETFAVVGVLPAGFDFPFGSEIWAPRELTPYLPSRTAHNAHVVGRLAPGVTLAAAHAQADAVATRLAREHGDHTDMVGVALVPLLSSLVGDSRPTLFVQLGAAAFLFLVATINVGSLLLARLETQRRDLAVRLALGARGAQLGRYLLAESLVVTASAALTSGALATAALALLRTYAPSALPRLDAVRIDAPVVALAVALAVGTAALLALAATRRALAWNVESELRAGGRSAAGRRAGWLAGLPIAAQAAAAMVLLVGVALLGASARRLLAVDPGFRSEGVLAVELFPGGLADDTAQAARISELDGLIERFESLPGARAAGLVSALPLAGDAPNGTFIDLGSAAIPGDFEEFDALMRGGLRTGDALYLVASEGYFRALSIPLVDGRLFTPGDDGTAPHVALVSASLARRTWPAESALGRRLEFGNMDGDLRAITVVGVVGDVRQSSLGDAPAAAIYVPFRQRPKGTRAVAAVVASSAGIDLLAPAALAAARELVPHAPARSRELANVVDGSWADRRLLLQLVGLFAASALALAGAGVFGAVALAAAARRRDYAIRLALGATGSEVIRHAMRGALMPALAGFGAGAVLALALGRAVASLLFELRPAHAPAYGAALAAVIVVALVAAWIPARRAARLEPAAVLASE